MDVIETVYTDAQFHDLGTISNSGLNVAYGSDDNDFEVTTFADVDIPDRGLVYVRIRRDGKLVGTEYGGMVTKRNPHADSDGKAVVTYGGASWHGILNDHVICPPSGSEYLHVSGEANAAIGTVLSALGLTELFAASDVQSGLTVSHDFRYASGYDGLTAMLSEKGAKLIMAFDGSHVVLSAIAIHGYSADAEFDQSQVHLDLKIDGNPVNHLICMGTGEGVDRLRVDLYADSSGNVSTTQTQFGLAVHEEEYDYTSADVQTLTTDGEKKLKDYQDAATTIEVTVEPSLTEFDVGDIIGAIARSGNTIDTVSAYVTYKSATVNGEHLDVTYKAGTVLKTAEEQAAQTQTAQSIAALNEALAAHDTANAAAITAKDAATITITSTHGSVFKGNAITTSLNVSVFQPGGTRIETQAALEAAFGSTARIEWKWRKNTDEEWKTIVSTDSRLSNKGFSLAITPADVDERTSFEATMETD